MIYILRGTPLSRSSHTDRRQLSAEYLVKTNQCYLLSNHILHLRMDPKDGHFLSSIKMLCCSSNMKSTMSSVLSQTQIFFCSFKFLAKSRLPIYVNQLISLFSASTLLECKNSHEIKKTILGHANALITSLYNDNDDSSKNNNKNNSKNNNNNNYQTVHSPAVHLLIPAMYFIVN